MARVLQGLIGRICLEYLDDVIVFSKSRTEHAADLWAIFDRIGSADLKMMPLKCSMFADQVLYLNHVISAANVSPHLAKLRVLAEWPTVKTVRKMQSFLRFVNFYNDNISDPTKLTQPLYDLTAAGKGDESIKLTVEHLESFENIKRRLCTAPKLAHPDLEQPFVLYTDASKITIGAALLQRNNIEVKRVILLFSKKLSPAQQNYSTIKRECLAIIYALEQFRVYLLGRKFRLRNDHCALAWIFSNEPKAFARISGWLATLIKYPIVIEYVCKLENSIADAFSRLDSVAVDNELPANLARGVPCFFCPPPMQDDRLEGRTDLLTANVLTIQFHSSPIY